LSREFLETLEELTGRGICQNQPTGHNPPRFRSGIPNRLLKSDACQRYSDVAMYAANGGNLAGKNLSLM
jgi:hypothetical protein